MLIGIKQCTQHYIDAMLCAKNGYKDPIHFLRSFQSAVRGLGI